jgi:lipid II:glycine glycyltransferase (peptidoglycan interpeptide bridge formation enzyme)
MDPFTLKNMLKITSNIDEIDKLAWTSFIEQHEFGNFFQSPEYYLALNDDPDHIPIVLIAENEKEIVGVLVMVIQKQKLGWLSYLSSKLFIHGGPIVKNNDPKIAGALIDTVIKTYRKAALYSEIKNLFDLSHFNSTLFSRQFKFFDHLNIEIDLTKSMDQLWSEVDSKKRNKIRKAEKSNATFQLLEELNNIDQTIGILMEVHTRVKIPLPRKEYFESIQRNTGHHLFKVFVTRLNEKIIAVIYAFCFGGRIFIWYSGAYQTYFPLRPNDYLHWKVMVWAKENGYRVFDFGGAGKPGQDYGVRDFKKKFGGELVNYGRYVHINQPLLYALARLGFRSLKLLRNAFS